MILIRNEKYLIMVFIYGHIVEILTLVVQFFDQIKDNDNRFLVLVKRQLLKCTNLRVFQFFIRIQEVDDGFFEKFGHLKKSVETKEAIKEEENQERVNYQEDDSSQDEPILDNISLEDESLSKYTCSVSFFF